MHSMLLSFQSANVAKLQRELRHRDACRQTDEHVCCPWRMARQPKRRVDLCFPKCGE
jgi:hypothetical protein